MASSRASTSAGRKRTAKRASRAKPVSTRRGARSHKPRKTAQPAPPAKPKGKAAKPKPPARLKSGKAKPPRAVAAPPKGSTPRGLTLLLIVSAVSLGLVALYFFWFRDSSFVAVEKVAVEGITGPESSQVTEALTEAAQDMTTLNVDERELAAAVSGFPTVVAVQANTDFPHGLEVEVTARPPVLIASDGSSEVPVAGDGTLLRGVSAEGEGLPEVGVESIPAGAKLDGEPLTFARTAGAAPDPIRALIKDLAVEPGEGIQVTLRGGIPVKFGDPDALEEKWSAVAAILANPQVKTLTHLDVRVPGRPSIGGAAPPLKGD